MDIGDYSRNPEKSDQKLSFLPMAQEAVTRNGGCDDIQKTYEELKKRGVELEGLPQKQPWGTYAMFKDSEANRFVISS